MTDGSPSAAIAPGRNGQPPPLGPLSSSSSAPETVLMPPPRAGTLPGPRAGDGPEVGTLEFGFVPLTDCASLVVAREKGFFARFGLAGSLQRQPSWSALRDAVVSGRCHGAHMLFGMPVANALGRLGSPTKPLVVPWLLSRNGQAITLNARFKGQFGPDPGSLRTHALERRDRGRPMAFGITLQPGTHAMWLRYWLGAGDINPDEDVALVTIPPPQMVKNMAMGNLDGYCVGEPWNARAVATGVGFTAITSQEIWPGHPEKVLAFTEEFAEKNPRTVKAVLKALHLASLWADDPANREELATLLARPEYVHASVEEILPRLRGTDYDLGDGRRVERDPHPLSFNGHPGANSPQPKYALWWLSQMRRWNMTLGAPDYAGITARVMRPDLHDDAMAELGLEPVPLDSTPEMLFDNVVFDPADPEGYARGFRVRTAKFTD